MTALETLPPRMTMPSSTYGVFVLAMTERRQIVCTYGGYKRELCPHILGLNKEGEEAALVFQFGGESKGGLPKSGQWRCLRLSQVSNPVLRDGEFQGIGGRHSKRQHCVADVDLDVNPASPYSPKRRLPP